MTRIRSWALLLALAGAVALLLVPLGRASTGYRPDLLGYRPAAAAHSSYPELNAVARRWAPRPAGAPQVSLDCPTREEWDADPNAYGAWGYTYAGGDVAYIDPDLCGAALAWSRGDPDWTTWPLWERATAVLVITHESFHMRRWDWNGSEARVECQAIRKVLTSMRMLNPGLTALEEPMMGWALAAHFRIGVLAPEYNLPGCRVPWPWV